jgi:hypothetical protein
MPDKYYARREDNGVLIEVTFEQVMDQQAGYITLSDGVLAKRCVYLEQDGKPLKTATKQTGPSPEIVSDTLGCGMYQVEELREHARRNGCRVEFTPDPEVPQFYQARFGSEKAKWEYAKSRGLHDKNGLNGGGAVLSAEQLERAKVRLLESSAS